MKYSPEEVIQFVQEEDVKFIRLAFCDVYGKQKNITIMPSQLQRAFTYGVAFDASAIAGFGGVARSDLLLRPDLSTFTVLPWRPAESGVGLVFCNITYPDGRPFEGDGRWLLGQLEQRALRQGYSFLVGPECEFYLFETDEKGRPTHTPFDEAGYFDIAPLDKGENVRRQICLALEEMGVQPERSHHEQGPGQNEVDFRCASPLAAADHLVALRTAVKATARENGLFASFSPKPLANKSGSGLHINLSLFFGGHNLFEGFCQAPNEKAAAFLAGVLAHAAECMPFTNPLPGSYARLGGFEAPGTVSWSPHNRSCLVRVPAATGQDSRIELRSPDPSCNPYFATLLLLSAGFEGVLAGLALPEAADGDLFAGGAAPRLPASLGQALGAARQSEFLRRALPQKLLDTYLACKQEEFDAYEYSGDRAAYEAAHYFPRI